MSNDENVQGYDGLFYIDEEPVVNWPVTIPVPQDGGTVREHLVHMDLQYGTAKVIEEELASTAHPDFAEKIGTPEDPLFRRVHGWQGIAAKGKGAMPFTAANKAVVLCHTPTRQGIATALVELAVGMPAKNSKTPPGTGPAPNRKARRAAEKASKKNRRS